MAHDSAASRQIAAWAYGQAQQASRGGRGRGIETLPDGRKVEDVVFTVGRGW